MRESDVKTALNEVVDPCSVGRGVPAGIVDMGMVCGVELNPGRVDVEVRITSPGCMFHLWFEEQIRLRLQVLPGVDEVCISWSKRFDWTDDDMTAALKQRLREKRDRMIAEAKDRRNSATTTPSP